MIAMGSSFVLTVNSFQRQPHFGITLSNLDRPTAPSIPRSAALRLDNSPQSKKQ
jgi:hypothetical protein